MVASLNAQAGKSRATRLCGSYPRSLVVQLHRAPEGGGQPNAAAPGLYAHISRIETGLSNCQCA